MTAQLCELRSDVEWTVQREAVSCSCKGLHTTLDHDCGEVASMFPFWIRNAVLADESRVVDLPAPALMAVSSRIGWKRASKLVGA